METTDTAKLIKRYLESFEGLQGTRLQDVLDEDIFEVLSGVAWVREALAEFSPTLAQEDQQDILSGLRIMAA